MPPALRMLARGILPRKVDRWPEGPAGGRHPRGEGAVAAMARIRHEPARTGIGLRQILPDPLVQNGPPVARHHREHATRLMVGPPPMEETAQEFPQEILRFGRSSGMSSARPAYRRTPVNTWSRVLQWRGNPMSTNGRMDSIATARAMTVPQISARTRRGRTDLGRKASERRFFTCLQPLSARSNLPAIFLFQHIHRQASTAAMRVGCEASAGILVPPRPGSIQGRGFRC